MDYYTNSKNNLLESFSSIVWQSNSPKHIFGYSPSILILPSGRIVVSLDRGGGMAESFEKGIIFVSDNGGVSWREVAKHPLEHARLFCVKNDIYLIGHREDVGIICSHDNAETWEKVSFLTKGQKWHSAPTNVLYVKGRIYLVMEQYLSFGDKEWPVGWLAPVVWHADLDNDLINPCSWQQSKSRICFQEHLKTIENIGMPFFPIGNNTANDSIDNRYNAPLGWLEGNICMIFDHNHCWFDPRQKTFQILLRSHTGGIPNYACILKAVLDDDGVINIEFQKSPAGNQCLFLPFPGGHLKFYILYDEFTKKYFMVSNISNDSMTIPSMLDSRRYNLPYNERRYLGLYVSRNLVDWNFLGAITCGKNPKEARNYPSFAFCGEDLLLISRSGDMESSNAHNSNLITFHRVQRFRRLLRPWH